MRDIIRYPDPGVFRIDPNARKKGAQKELQRLISEQLSIETLKNSNLIRQNFIPMIYTFSKTHAAESLAVGSGDSLGESLIFYERVPERFIGFLESIALTPLGTIPGTWYKILIDGETLDGYSNANGKIERAIGTFVEPRPLIPPIVVYESIKVYAGNTTAASWSAGFSCEGIHVQKPKIIGIKDPLVTANVLKDFVRSQS